MAVNSCALVAAIAAAEGSSAADAALVAEAKAKLALMRKEEAEARLRAAMAGDSARLAAVIAAEGDSLVDATLLAEAKEKLAVMQKEEAEAALRAAMARDRTVTGRRPTKGDRVKIVDSDHVDHDRHGETAEIVRVEYDHHDYEYDEGYDEEESRLLTMFVVKYDRDGETGRLRADEVEPLLASEVLAEAIATAKAAKVADATIQQAEERLAMVKAQEAAAEEVRRALAAAQTAAELKAALEDATTVRASPLPRASFLVHFSHPPRRLQAAVLEESELTPHRARLGEMVVGALERAADARSLKAALDVAAGATGKEVEAALSKARSRLAELRNSEKWKAERVKAGVDHLMLKERPSEHLCPIGYDVMVDPVTAGDGMTYERASIETWLQENDTSPSTGAELPHTTLVPNQVLKSIIRDWEEQEHKKCMAMAAAQAQPPPLALQDTPTLRAELQKREEAKAAAASGSAATEVAPTPARQSTETLKAETAALEAEVARKQGELRRREAAKEAAANLERQPSSSES